MIKRTFLSIAAILLLSACEPESNANKAQPELPRKLIQLNSMDGTKTATIDVEIADEDPERQTGMMFRQELEFSKGMLFVWNEAKPRAFWMKNTYVPLDMIFMHNGLVMGIVHHAKPLSTDHFHIGAIPADAVLEVPAGYAMKQGIKIGWKMKDVKSQ